MDFNLDEREKMLQRTAKEFATNSVEPQAAEIDRGGQFPFDLVKEIGNRGYQGLSCPIIADGLQPAYQQQADFILSKTPRQITMPSPCLGEHIEYVYKELLGMTDDEIAEHIIDGSITTALPEGFQFTANF